MSEAWFDEGDAIARTNTPAPPRRRSRPKPTLPPVWQFAAVMVPASVFGVLIGVGLAL